MAKHCDVEQSIALHILPYYQDDGDGAGDDDGDGDGDGDDRIQHGGGIQYNAHSKA